MITLKNNKLPKLHLRLYGYEIEHENEHVIEYRKHIVLRNEFYYPLIYYIHIFYHKDDTDSNVCVSKVNYLPDPDYFWYSGKYENEALKIINTYDHSLLKYLKEVE